VVAPIAPKSLIYGNLEIVGAQATLAFGGLGYAMYSASFLCYNHTKNEGFVLFAGAFLGVCAGLLWCAQGTVMMVGPVNYLAQWGANVTSPILRRVRKVGISDFFGPSLIW